MTPVATSLRDRQRAQVRADINRAALRLFAGRGFDAVSTEEIADAAGISHSTYFRHVASKEDLLLDPVRGGGSAIVHYLRERPPDESAAQAVSEAILARSAAFGTEPDSLANWRTAILSAPQLLDRVALVDREQRDKMVELAAERMSSHHNPMRLAGLLVHVLLSTAEYIFTRWLLGSEDDGAGLHESTRQALNDVRSNLWR